MSDKSHVGMGFHLCPICYEKHDEVVLLDTRLRDTLERNNFMGFELCPKHEEMSKEYVALVEVSNKPSKPEEAKPTGGIAHIRRAAWSAIFPMPCPEGPLAYCEVGTLAALQKHVTPPEAP